MVQKQAELQARLAALAVLGERREVLAEHLASLSQIQGQAKVRMSAFGAANVLGRATFGKERVAKCVGAHVLCSTAWACLPACTPGLFARRTCSTSLTSSAHLLLPLPPFMPRSCCRRQRRRAGARCQTWSWRSRRRRRRQRRTSCRQGLLHQSTWVLQHAALRIRATVLQAAAKACMVDVLASEDWR